VDAGGQEARLGSSGDRNLVFADSSNITWSSTLTITNWQGVARTQSDVTKRLFGTGGLDSVQLAQIQFAGYRQGSVLVGGELAPIPEAPVVWGAVAVTAVIFWRERRRSACRLPQWCCLSTGSVRNEWRRSAANLNHEGERFELGTRIFEGLIDIIASSAHCAESIAS